MSLLASSSTRKLGSAAAVMPKFISSIDQECKNYIKSLLDPKILQLQESKHFGMGLYATRNIRRGEIILKEKPFLSTETIPGAREVLVARLAPLGWRDDYFLVASAVASAMKSDAWPIVPHSYLPLRCLGYTDLQTKDNIMVADHLYPIITKVFGLQDLQKSIWSADDCQILYHKIKSNCFASNIGSTDVFCAASMLNHSCLPNASFVTMDCLRAENDIPAGDQVFVSYQVMDPAADLPELYGFKCHCPLCLGSTQ